MWTIMQVSGMPQLRALPQQQRQHTLSCNQTQRPEGQAAAQRYTIVSAETAACPLESHVHTSQGHTQVLSWLFVPTYCQIMQQSLSFRNNGWYVP
jgi:hypothetical protein